jgi:hypothetical protein
MLNLARKTADTQPKTSLFVTLIEKCLGEPLIKIHSTTEESMKFVEEYIRSTDSTYVTAYIFEKENPIIKVSFHNGRMELTHIYNV